MQNNKRKIVDEHEEGLLQQLASKYFPYWPMFLLAILVAAGVAFFYLRYATPIYEATASILIKDEKKGNEDSKMVESLDLISSKKIVENEIEVIQSRSLMDDVVKKLYLYASIIEKGDIKNNSAYLSSPLTISAENPDSIVESKMIKLDINTKDSQVVLNNKYRYPMNKVVLTPFGQLEFLPNKNFEKSDRPLKQLYFSLSNPRDVDPALLSGLKVQASGKLSSIIDLSYRDEIPRRAEDILNELIIAYDRSGIREKDKLAANTLKFVEDRLSNVAHDLDSIEKKVQQYKSGQGAVDVSTQGQLFLQNVSTNDQKLSDVNMQLSVLNQVQKFVTDKDNKGAIVPSTLGVSDPMLSQLLDKLYNSELEYERLKKITGENSTIIISITDQINKIKPSIIQNIESQKRSLDATKANLYITNGAYNSMLQSVPQKERQLLDISRQQETKRGIYAFLLQKREESQLSYASTVSDHRVIDNALASPIPVSPKRPLIYLISIMGCLAVCIVIITIKESLTGKVLYRQEIESRTQIPIIGEIAFDKSKTPLVIESGKRSFVAEEFRKLRISLSFLGIDNAHKKILVTSSISGEGKSFIAANLAVSLSLTGKKVVLVDLDLNNPTISKILNVTQEEGITEFLTGQKEPEEIIKRVKAHENLFFISAGTLPENPSELLANGKVSEIIDYLDNIFDIVIIDTSPIVLVTDAYILSPLCNATLYIIKHKYTPKALVKRIDEEAQINPINNPAIIFNGVKVRGFFKKNYGYGYDYVYGNKDRGSKKLRKPSLKY